MIEKEFDAVEMMRSIRDRLNEKYYRNPKQMLIDLKVSREKHAHLGNSDRYLKMPR